MYLSGYGILVGFIILSVAFASAALVASFIVQPKAPGETKHSTYECGMQTYGDARIKFGIKYYIYALLFLIFDIETIFLFPWAVSYNKLGLFALVEAIIFIVILLLGLFYVWGKDLLRWK